MKSRRDFITVLRIIANMLPENQSNELTRSAGYWAPEIRWQKLSEFINSHVRYDADDPNTICIYSALCNKPVTEIRKMFIDAGF